MMFINKQFLKKKLQRIALFFVLILFTSCEPALISNSGLNTDNSQLLKVNMFEEDSADYVLSGNAVGSNKLTEIYASFFSCSVSGDVGNGNSIKLSTATIIWNNNCAFKINSIVYDGVTYAAGVSNPSITMSAAIYTAQVGTGTSLTTPINIPLSSGYQLQLTATNLYTSALSGGASFTPPSITFNLNVPSQTNRSAGISSTIIPFVGTGDGFSCALVYPGGVSTAGELYCWGDGGAGRVATGTAKWSFTGSATGSFAGSVSGSLTLAAGWKNSVTGYDIFPKKINMPAVFPGNPTALAVGNEIACVLDKNGSPWCWGLFKDSSCGSTFSNIIIKYDTSDTRYSSIVAGYQTACGITTAGTVKCWGDLSSIIPHGGTNVKAVEVSPNFSSVSQIAVGFDFMCGLMNGKVQCYGNNRYGQLGINSESPLALTSASQVVTQGAGSAPGQGSGTLPPSSSVKLSNVTSISANGKVACATVSGANNAYCWGNVNGAKDRENEGVDKTTLLPNYSHFELLGNGSYNIYCPTYSYNIYTFSYKCDISKDYVAFASPVKLIDERNKMFKYQTMVGFGTPISLSLSSISVGMAAACGINSDAGNSYTCWGVDLTQPKAQYSLFDVYFYNIYGTDQTYYWARGDWGVYTIPRYSAAYSSWGSNSSAGKGTLPSSIYSMSVGGNYSLINNTKDATPYYTLKEIFYLDGIKNYLLTYDYGNVQSLGQICVALVDASIWCWGGNTAGEVGNSTTTNVTQPALIMGPAGYTNNGTLPQKSY